MNRDLLLALAAAFLLVAGCTAAPTKACLETFGLSSCEWRADQSNRARWWW